MRTKIKIFTESAGEVAGEIDDSLNPGTAEKIVSNLPFTSSARLWGDEIYFDVPISIGEEQTQVEVEVGDLAFWPAGNCFCIFFGRTPASTSEKPRAASAVNVFGRITDDPVIFEKVGNGETVKIELDS